MTRGQHDDLAEKLRQTADKLGHPIDDHIFQPVLALNSINIPTFASCEGHIDHGENYPWIDIGDPENKRFEEIRLTANSYWEKANQMEKDHQDPRLIQKNLQKYHQARIEASQISMKLITPIFEILRSFYINRTVEYGIRIIATPIGHFLRLQPEDGVSQILRTKQEQQSRLEKYRKEFDSLANFILNK